LDDGNTVKQHVYLPVADRYAILVFATDFDDEAAPPVHEVAETILRTMELSD
jgi:hypothetical protein